MKFMDVPDLQQPCISDTSDDSPQNTQLSAALPAVSSAPLRRQGALTTIESRLT